MESKRRKRSEELVMRNLGIEPRAPRWQRRILPLNQLRVLIVENKAANCFQIAYLGNLQSVQGINNHNRCHAFTDHF